MADCVRYDLTDNIATVTLDRPERRNALNHEAYAQLEGAFRQAQRDGDVRCVILTGADPSFCSGDDVKEIMLGEGRKQTVQLLRAVRPPPTPAATAVLECDRPVICAVNGPAVGWGMDLSLFCDIRIASERAKFGELFIKRGLISDVGGLWRLPRIVGPSKAAELLFTGDVIDAAEAERIAREAGVRLAPAYAFDLLRRGYEVHHRTWVDGRSSGSPEIVEDIFDKLGLTDPEREKALTLEFEQVLLDAPVFALDGAPETLAQLAERGIPRALVCDTGYSPGRVVRRVLDGLGLLELLDVQIFSDECGVPKPHHRIFEAALQPLGVAPDATVHVGDLRRTDVAGARGMGMASVHIRHHNDDESEHPEADQVADSHAHLQEILGLR